MRLVIVAVVLVSCSTNKVVEYLNPEAPFTKYETFMLKANDKMRYQGDIAGFIESEMTRRGYQLSSISPDLLVVYDIGSSSRTEIDRNNYSIYYPSFPASRNIHESFLIITLLDDRKTLVWQGSQKLRRQSPKETMEDVLKESVHLIFKTYLYSAKSGVEDQSLLNIN